MIHKYLLKADQDLFDEIDSARAILNMTRADFIRQSIRKNLKYHNKIILPLYHQLEEKKRQATRPETFFMPTPIFENSGDQKCYEEIF